MQEIQTIKKLQFDKAALTYDYYASAQHTTGLFLSKYLNKNYSSITELGCGTGIFTQHLQLNQKNASISAIDASHSMIEYCKTNPRLDTVNFIVSKIEKCKLPQSDLICSNGCLQWIPNKKDLFTKLYRSLNPNGDLIFSCYGPNTFKELQDSLHQSFPSHPPVVASQFSTIETLHEHLKITGFSILESTKKTLYVPFPNLVSFLKTIKYTGTKPQTQPSLWTSKQLLKLESTFKQLYGSIFASYDTFLIKAKRND